MPTPDWRIPQSFEEEPLSSSFGRDLYRQTFVDRAHAAGLAGATVLRGIDGYGASQRVHTTRLLSLIEELPVVIVTVDEADRIERFAVQLDEVITEGLVVIYDVEVVRYVGRPGARGAGESA